MIETRNVPRRPTPTLGRLAPWPSQVSWTFSRAGKPVPSTTTVEPAGPVAGARDSVAATGVAAKPAENGRTRARATRRTVTFATKFAQREPAGLGGGVGLTSGTHRVPSHKVNVVLHSATRLTQGVPWLCGPASRRVCLFRGAHPDGEDRWI